MADIETVSVITKDGETFSLPRKQALLSGTIKGMLEVGAVGEVPLMEVDGATLKHVIQYLKWLETRPVDEKYPERGVGIYRYNHAEEEKEYFDALSPEEVRNVVVAANFLHIDRLLHAGSAYIAKKLEGKNPDGMREILDLPDDLTQEQKAEILKESDWLYDEQ